MTSVLSNLGRGNLLFGGNSGKDERGDMNIPAGKVGESGEVISRDTGEVIGKVVEGDLQGVVGNTVNLAGQVVSEDGVVGQALPLGKLDGEEGVAGGATSKDGLAGGLAGKDGLLGGVTGKDGLLSGVTGKEGLVGGIAGGASQDDTPARQESQAPSEQGLPDRTARQADTSAETLGNPAQREIEPESEIQMRDNDPQEADTAQSSVPEGLDAPTESAPTEPEIVQEPEKLEEPAADKDKGDEKGAPVDRDSALGDETAEPAGEKTADQSTTDLSEVPADAIDDKTEEKLDENVKDKIAEVGEEKPAEGLEEKIGEATEGIAREDAEEKDEDDTGGKAAEVFEQISDITDLKGLTVNKLGNLVKDGIVVGRVKSGVLKNLVGRKVADDGKIWQDGNTIGEVEIIPESEREDYKEGSEPFADFEGAIVEGSGKVMYNGEQIGIVTEGDPKQLRNKKIEPDGTIIDSRGEKVGFAERWEAEPEPEPEPEKEVDRSILAGKRVNKLGNVVDASGTIYGKVIEGDIKSMVGRMADKQGNIRSETGDIIGRAELVPEGEREGSKEGPFTGLEGCTVNGEGKIVTPGGGVVGRLTKGDAKVLLGRVVDDDGDIIDKNGNVLGKAERWEEPKVEKKKGRLEGLKVDKEGNVRDPETSNVIAKLVAGETIICAGKEIDGDGDVINSKGNTIGHVALLEDIPAPPEDPKETEEERKKREEQEEDTKLAKKMAVAVQGCLDKILPICKMITSHIEKAERTPKDELDEEALVKNVKPLIEEGGRVLSEANGVIRGLDPDGHIQANAKHKAAGREATPEEYHLAEVLKELTGTVSQTIDNAKKKIEDMPHAKKELNPLWGLLTEPLFQILAAVGLLLQGVLGLVGRLLSGLGLGGLVDNLLGGLGIKNILNSLGVGSLTDALTGKNQGGKKK